MEELVPALHQWLSGVRQHVFSKPWLSLPRPSAGVKRKIKERRLAQNYAAPDAIEKELARHPDARVGQLLRSVFFKLLKKAAEINAERKKEDRMKKLKY